MKTYKILALDETGKASFSHRSKSFILSGFIAPEPLKERLEIIVRRLKKKYFDDENIVFHAREMLRKKSAFASLQENPRIELAFWSEFIAIVNREELSFISVIVDKEKARLNGWNEIAILRKVYTKMLEEFIGTHLVGDAGGKIVAESDPAQDKYLLEAHNRLQSVGVVTNNISAHIYRNRVTSLSLVNKANLDIDVQIADILAIMIKSTLETEPTLKRISVRVQRLMTRFIKRKTAREDDSKILELLP